MIKKIFEKLDKESITLIQTLLLSVVISVLIIAICLYLVDDGTNPLFSKLTRTVLSANTILLIPLAIFTYLNEKYAKSKKKK